LFANSIIGTYSVVFGIKTFSLTSLDHVNISETILSRDKSPITKQPYPFLKYARDNCEYYSYPAISQNYMETVTS
jgi:hypothetical protein